MPFIRSIGVDAPVLPAQVNLAESSSRNQSLTKRKYDLQKYLVQMIVLLSDRAPVPLLQFLNMQEQLHLGFSSLEQLKKLSELNLIGAQARILRNAILVGPNNRPKVYFQLQLYYQSFALPIETPRNNQQIITFSDVEAKPWIRLLYAKTYGDFKKLNNLIVATNIQTDYQQSLPVFPDKKTSGGAKRSTDDL